MCARFIYANTVTQDTQNAPPALRASPGSNRSKQRPGHCVPREPRPRCAYVCACAHAHVSLNWSCVSLSILREIIASGHAQNLSKKYGGGTAGHRHRCLGERADCRETAERADNIRFTVQREGRPNPSRPDPAGGPRRAWATSLRGAPCRSSRSSPRASRWRRPWRCSPSPR